MSSTTPGHAEGRRASGARLDLLWLEITGLCQLRCQHGYADSGPHGTHGTLSVADWTSILDQARELDTSLVQFIGGEPTLHPGLPRLVDHALHLGLEVEVYTNLVRVSDELWRVFRRDGVRLATSYYSTVAAEHDAITGRRSHARTLANIQRIRSPEWRRVFERVPRHLFVPRFDRYPRYPDPGRVVIDGSDPEQQEEWLASVYSDTVLNVLYDEDRPLVNSTSSKRSTCRMATPSWRWAPAPATTRRCSASASARAGSPPSTSSPR